eukprot:338596-Hanusia_phi.AAC.2
MQAMVFNLVTAAKEWLESNNLSAAQVLTALSPLLLLLLLLLFMPLSEHELQDWGAYEEEEEEDESKKRNKVSFLLCSWPKMTKTQSGILKGVVGVTPVCGGRRGRKTITGGAGRIGWMKSSQVNPDNFLAWRTKFEAEIEAQRQAEETGHRTVTGLQEGYHSRAEGEAAETNRCGAGGEGRAMEEEEGVGAGGSGQR